jgi:hypothetical protein
MRKLTLIITITLALAIVPALALAHCGSCAMDDKSGGSKKMAAGHADHDHSGHDDHKGHSGMAAAGGMLELGSKTEKGVEAHADLKDVRAALAKTGMKTTHHFMIMFHDEKTGKPLESGTVAVKIIGPDGTTMGPLELIGMQGHFGADVALAQPGEYRFQVGSKLTDGETRQFEFKTSLQ